jgi:hypothetical protein
MRLNSSRRTTRYAAYKDRTTPQFSPNLRRRLKQLFITLKVRKGVVHAHDSVEIPVRNFSQIQHVRDEQLNIQTPLCSFHAGPFNRRGTKVTGGNCEAEAGQA